MIARVSPLLLAALLVGRPVFGQRLADLPPVYIPPSYLQPAPPPQCTVATHAMWAVGGAIVGVMASLMVVAIMAGDGGPSTAHRRQAALIMSGGALVGGVYGWFALAPRYSCG